MRGINGLILAVLTVHAVAGPRWRDVSTGLTGPYAAVSALAVNASGSTIYALTSASSIFGAARALQIFRSTDAGASWKPLGNIVGVLAMALDPTSATTIYAGTNRGVFASTDGGDTWSSAGLEGKRVSLLVIDPI